MHRKILKFKNFNLKNSSLIVKKNITRLKTLINTLSANSFRKGCEYHSLVSSFTHTQSKTGKNNKEEEKLSKTTLLLVTRM